MKAAMVVLVFWAAVMLVDSRPGLCAQPLGTPAVAAQIGEAVPYAAIDPLAADAGDFLDEDIGALSQQAFEAYLAGDYKLAAQIYLYVLQRNISDAELIYSLACCYAQLGDAYLSSLYLERAAVAGFDNLQHLLTDAAFAKVRGDPLFDMTVEMVKARVAQANITLGELSYKPAPALQPVRVVLPPDYDPRKTYPLLVGLHGHGSSADWFAKIAVGFQTPQFIYAVPQGPYAFLSGRQLGYSWLDLPSGGGLHDGTLELSEAYILAVIDSLRAQHKIGDVYLLGFSQGGIMAYDLGIRRPELIHGVMCFGARFEAGWLTAEQIAAAKDLRVFIAHGRQDTDVDFRHALAAQSALEAAGYNVTFEEYQGGHGLSVDVLKAAEQWMLR